MAGKSFQGHSGALPSIQMGDTLRVLRSDAHFADLLPRLGLKP